MDTPKPECYNGSITKQCFGTEKEKQNGHFHHP